VLRRLLALMTQLVSVVRIQTTAHVRLANVPVRTVASPMSTEFHVQTRLHAIAEAAPKTALVHLANALVHLARRHRQKRLLVAT